MKMETGWAIESLLLFNIFTTEICISVPNGFQESPDFLQDLPPLSAGFIFSTTFVPRIVAVETVLTPRAYRFDSHNCLSHIPNDFLMLRAALPESGLMCGTLASN